MPYDPEARREYYQRNKERHNASMKEWRDKNKDYMKNYSYSWKRSEKGYKSQTISCWKGRGINCDEEWDEVFDWWLNAKTCNICDKEFVISTDKCLDHDHILEGYNVRGVLCQKCNNVSNEL